MRGRYFISGGVKARERANYGVMQGFCVVRCLACACVRYAGRACCVGVARQVSGRVEGGAKTGRCQQCQQNSRARILSRAEELRAFFIKKMCSQLILESFIGNFLLTLLTNGLTH